MARQKNDGKGRMGGRQKGTPNKITSLARGMMEKWLELHNSRINPSDLRELIWDDFMELTPKERVMVSLDFIKIILPRTVAVNDADGERVATIEDRLAELAGEDENG